ncbi:MAG TPA: hypothetical protein VNJ08_15135 [Bacteriovoracaceae bacterium]|nr:hypothetical protein [Bacteriovoracaceae bacterium]
MDFHHHGNGHREHQNQSLFHILAYKNKDKKLTPQEEKKNRNVAIGVLLFREETLIAIGVVIILTGRFYEKFPNETIAGVIGLVTIIFFILYRMYNKRKKALKLSPKGPKKS